MNVKICPDCGHYHIKGKRCTDCSLKNIQKVRGSFYANKTRHIDNTHDEILRKLEICETSIGQMKILLMDMKRMEKMKYGD